jgi:rod shape determining protein RodA
MITGNHNALNIGKIDWWAVLIFLVLTLMGWVNIYSVLQEGAEGGILDISTRYGRQLIWVGVSLFVAIAILLIDDKYYHIFAYPAYWVSIAILAAVLLVGREVNGAKAWIYIGGQGIQPAEFAKFTTALALARYMSRFNFSPRRVRDVVISFAIIVFPAAIIILQRDTGSAMVYAAFMFIFFREGMNGWIFTLSVMAVAIFVLSFLLTPFAMLAGIIWVCTVAETVVNGRIRAKIVYLATLILVAIAIYFGVELLFGRSVSLYLSLLIASIASILLVVGYAYRNRLRNVFNYLGLFVFSLIFASSVDYVFNNVMETHQQQRILLVLGIEGDISDIGYQTNQSKIAIGSGGWLGKGYLEGTQTRFNFVPEQSTDYIFCTVGEEWGFVGSTLVLALFCALVVRLMKMAERQQEAFNRIYIYSVAAIFLLHIIINIGMTVGIMPVIGIPLPLFSYGGSSLLAFTILFFVAVKLGTTKRDV